MIAVILSIAAAAGISLYTFVAARKWSRLDYNLWKGKPLGGFLSGWHPGTVPATYSVEEIRMYGRINMVAAPCLFVIFTLFILFASRTLTL